jgi:cytosine/creatinine deaminase
MVPKTGHYWLINAHVPTALLVDSSIISTISNSTFYPISNAVTNSDPEPDLVSLDLEIRAGQISQIIPAGTAHEPEVPTVDLERGLVWSCFIDLHSHLDKGHIWPRQANLDGSFATALEACQQDRNQYWRAEDLYRRMEFGLKCAYAHGTSAIRTHIDSFGPQAVTSLEVFAALKRAWGDRIELQAVTLVPLDYFMTAEGEKLADQIAAVDGLLGGLPQMGQDLEQQLDRVFALAQDRQLNLDFHTDESGDPSDVTLRQVAQAAVKHQFAGRIVCGHCCSLAVQSAEQVIETFNWLKQAQIGIVSLPMCNLYLQDRNQTASQQFTQAVSGDPLAHIAQFSTLTPRWRGVTLVHELKQFGIPVAFASDNCRDPFHAYGDHDGLEVFNQAVRIAQLEAPHANWSQSVTTIPANLMGLPNHGRIGVGLPADLILFKARYFHELLPRPQTDRTVLRQGKSIDTTLPGYSDLDDLWA